MFEGKVAIVTGASRGIGEATARRLAAGGAQVVLAARSADALCAIADGIQQAGGVALPVSTDVTSIAALDQLVEAAVARFGPVDVLVNNAGVLPDARRAERMTVDEWRTTLDLNLTGPWYLACRCKEAMAETGGVVVNVTSSASFYPSVGLTAYNASKAALNMLTRGLALEWARDAVRVVGIAPGKVDTALVQPILEYTARVGAKMNPLGRIGAPAEVAELIAFVASEAAAYITGSVITIDGGEVAGGGADLAR